MPRKGPKTNSMGTTYTTGSTSSVAWTYTIVRGKPVPLMTRLRRLLKSWFFKGAA